MKKNHSWTIWLLLAAFIVGINFKASAVEEPTLTQVWKHTTGLPTHSEARQGAGYGGKIYIQNNSSGLITIWDETGKSETTITTAKTGVGINIDDAGNIVIRNQAVWASTATDFLVFPKGSNTSQPLKLTPLNNGRTDYIGRITGNILSEEGGMMCVLSNGQTAINVYTIKQGVQTDVKAVTTTVTGDATTLVHPFGDKYIVHMRTSASVPVYSNDGTKEDLKTPGKEKNTTAGSCTAFQLGGITYAIYGTGDDGLFKDGFSIAEQENGTIVAVHTTEGTINSNSSFANHLTVEKVSETKVNIYQYNPGNIIAMYTFEVPGATKQDPTASFASATIVKTVGDAAFTNALTTNSDGTVTYVSSSESVATVSATGEVTILAAGTTTITATIAASDTYNEATASYDLTVEGAPVAGVVINGSFEEGTVGQLPDGWTNDSKSGFQIKNEAGIAHTGTNYLECTGTNCRIKQIVPVEIGKTYELSFWYNNYEAEGINGLKNYSLINSEASPANNYVDMDANGTAPKKLGAATEWTQYKKQFTATATSMSINIRAYEMCHIDDIELTEVKPDPVYIIGLVKGQNWSPNEGTELATTDGKIYTGKIEFGDTSTSFATFAIATQLGASADDWATVNANRYGPVTDRETLKNNTETTFQKISEGAYQIQAGEYDVTVDMENFTIKAVSTTAITYPENIYLFGEMAGFIPWDTNDVPELENKGEGIYTGTVTFTDSGYFTIASQKGKWDIIDANRYGASEANLQLTNDTATPLYGSAHSFKAPAIGEFEVTVDLAAMTVTCTAIATPAPEQFYLIGCLKNIDTWSPKSGVMLEKQADGTYTGEATFIDDSTWGLVEQLSDSGNEQTDWDIVNAHRYGPETDQFPVGNGVAVNISKSSYAFKSEPGKYNVTVDFVNQTVLCEAIAIEPEFVYPVANITKKATDEAFTNPLTSNTDGTVTYESSDETVATVDANGQVTILKAGTTTITAKAAETDAYLAANASYTLTVELVTPEMTFAESTIEKFTTDAAFTNALTCDSDGEITYESSNEAAATVDANGQITIVGEGTATITATAAATDKYEAATASYALTVVLPNSIDRTEIAVLISKTATGVHIAFEGKALVEVFNINGSLIEKTEAYDEHDVALNSVMYLIKVNGAVHKFVK